MQSLVFVALAPLGAVLMLVVGSVAWERREVPGGRALAAFSVAGAVWLVLDALSVIATSPEATVWLARAALAVCPLPGVAWLAFLLGYTGRLTPRLRRVVVGLTAWSVVFGGMALTSGWHGLVWATTGTVADGLFLGAVYTMGPLAWAQTAFMWSVIAVSLCVMLWTYGRAERRMRALSFWIVAGALVPLGINVIHVLGVGTVQKDFTPLAMAVSSGAFALGLVRYRLLDLRPIAREALVDGLREGMVVLDADDRVVDVNPALRDALGTATPVVGHPLGRTAPVLAAAVAAGVDDTLQIGHGDEARFYALRVSPLTDPEGAPSGCLVLLHDVTRRLQERAELHRINAELYDANAELQARNEELDAFAHTVAHDLKNSIQGVMGYSEILRDDGQALEPDLFHELADGLVSTGQKMGSIVQELLLLAGVRQAVVEPVPVDMAAVVDEAMRRLQWSPHGLAAPATVPASWPVAVGHAPWVEEIWVNYLTNAAKYGGPTVTLGAEVTDSGQARFWVHDDGPALSAKAQRSLFVAFSRIGEQAEEGHGLGLSIVRRIVERLDGTCGVVSEPGRGTQFWFALPAAPVLAAAPPTA